jgi:hypothetical protein
MSGDCPANTPLTLDALQEIICNSVRSLTKLSDTTLKELSDHSTVSFTNLKIIQQQALNHQLDELGPDAAFLKGK